MTAITVADTIVDISGQIKEVVVKMTSPDTGYTYDTLLDATDGKGAMFREIFSATYSELAEAVACTWVVATGVITLPTVASSPTTGYLIIRGI